jgi:hypothetical protein
LALLKGKQLTTWSDPFEVITRDTGLFPCLTATNGSTIDPLASERLCFKSPLVTSSDDFPLGRRAALILETKIQSLANPESVRVVVLGADEPVRAEEVDLILSIPYLGFP